MKKFLKHQFLWQKRAKIHFGIPLIGTMIIMVFMVVIILSNTYQLQSGLEQYAETYSEDVSEQLAARIAFRLKQRARDMRNQAEAFSQMPDEVVTEKLIKQKEEILDVSHLFIMKEDGTTYPEQEKIEGLEEYLQNEKGIEDQTHISFLDKNQVVFSTPMMKNGSLCLLISICTGDTLQEMLEDFNYDEKGRCCIADKNGSVIIAPQDMKPFKKVKQIFYKQNQTKPYECAVTDMIEDIRQEKSGWTIIKDEDKNEWIVGYDFLGVCDWMLFTVLPHDLLSATVKGNTMKFIMVGLALIVVTITIIVLIIRIYQKNMQRIQKAALTDPLTDGDNKIAFHMRGEYLLKELPGQMRAIVYLNNKDFKSYNSRFGINGADEILCDIYKVIRQNLNDQELLSRCDGTSFCLLLECESEAQLKERIKLLSHEIRKHLLDVYMIENHKIAQGAYMIHKKYYDFIDMLDWARLASTYQGDQEECKIFDDSIVKIIRRENELNAAFDHAIENKEFKLYIQPKISPQTEQLLGGEVLVRWEHPEFGLIPPNEFVPLFEKNGKICTLDLYMFEETCKLLKEWMEKGKTVPLSVNLSRANLGSHNFNFLNTFKRLKEQYQIPDGMIELELTESIVLERQEIPFLLAVINQIRNMGFYCSLDDFGYGYSSLTLLKDLNVNTIKLDRQFFINESQKSWVVVGSLIRMTHHLHISVVAEGIEEWEQVEKLKAYGCDMIQGYVYSKPLERSAFFRRLQEDAGENKDV